MTRDETKVLLGVLKTAFPRFYSDIGTHSPEFEEAVSLWHLMLGDVEPELAKLALYKLIATHKYPPTIAEMRECVADIRHPQLPDAGDAWKEVNIAITEYGQYREADAIASMRKATSLAVQCIGWRTLCCSEEKSEAADRAHFFAVYNSISKSIAEAEKLPSGLAESIHAIGRSKPGNFLEEDL